ncbi:ground-like domain protein [Teladorsagia circumcincta]|uniref:Ground-like domain protein n=1 Tax=Teladorsagia circumcincta TaxID=45464 RepID=A0A2G9V3V2_TELCI|nr:ground-like domain protein [Teladorsagia circumcincta]
MSTCKIHNGEYNYLAYETPIQYNPFDFVQEDILASTDSEEPLGSTRIANLRGDRPDVRVEPFAGEDLSLQPSPRQARALAFEGGKDSHTQRNKCCSSPLFELMADAFYELSSSPQFGFRSAGNIASLIQKRAQGRFGQSFEVIVSLGDFATASYALGDETCKYQERGFTAMAYATPVQYDITRTEEEEYLSSISSRDPLGATEPSLPGQRAFHTPLAVVAGGARNGFPVGSHCGPERSGSKCCNVALFEVMQSSYESLINRPNFDPYNTRVIARTIQYDVEERLGLSFEMVVSTDDFATASSYSEDNICKFRIDRYYVMAYESPVQV